MPNPPQPLSPAEPEAASERCPNDTDGDGNCHLCVRFPGGCEAYRKATTQPASGDGPQVTVGPDEAIENIIGRPDKPFHKAECQCRQCQEWIAAHPAPPQPAAELELPDGQVLINGLTPWQFAEQWYSEAEIVEAVKRNMIGAMDARPIPPDVASAEFGKWLTHEYRLAMHKGLDIAIRGHWRRIDERGEVSEYRLALRQLVLLETSLKRARAELDAVRGERDALTAKIEAAQLTPVETAHEVSAIVCLDLDVLADCAEQDDIDLDTLKKLVARVHRQKDEAINDPKARRERYAAVSAVFSLALDAALGAKP